MPGQATITDLTTRINFHLRDDSGSTTFTADPYLTYLNLVYRRMAALFPWPELRQIVTPSQLTTKLNTGQYRMPDTPAWVELQLVEIQDPFQNLKYVPIPPARDTLHWNLADRLFPAQMDLPVLYQLQDGDTSGLSRQIEFRPAPQYAGLLVRLSGVAEPVPLQPTTGAVTSTGAGTATLGSADDQTIWRTDTQDDLLAVLVAAYISDRRGLSGGLWADTLFGQAAQLLAVFSGTHVRPSAFRELLGLQPNLDAA